jgi:hypothetical protein
MTDELLCSKCRDALLESAETDRKYGDQLSLIYVQFRNIEKKMKTMSSLIESIVMKELNR